MVKKSKKKKLYSKSSVKERTGKSSNSQKESSISKKDFETFQFGVERLKELKRELDSLDTRGFSREEQIIRAKLKNVSEVPTIEKSLKILKAKINKKYRPHKRKSLTKEISEDIENIKEDLQTLRKSRRQGFEDIKEEIKKLKKSKRKDKGVVDPDVGLLVGANFDQFLNNTKLALSERIRKRENELDDTLKSDLLRRDLFYKKKHDNLLKDFEKKKKELENEYEKKYNQKVVSTLHKEVAQQFNIKLKEKLEKEKVELGKKYRLQLREHAQFELEKQKQILEDKLKKQFIKKSLYLDAQFKKKMYEENKKEKSLQEAKQTFNIRKAEEMNRMKDVLVEEAHKKLELEIKKKENLLREQIRNEYELRLKKRIKEHEQELNKKKLELKMEMQNQIEKLLNHK